MTILPHVPARVLSTRPVLAAAPGSADDAPTLLVTASLIVLVAMLLAAVALAVWEWRQRRRFLRTLGRGEEDRD